MGSFGSTGISKSMPVGFAVVVWVSGAAAAAAAAAVTDAWRVLQKSKFKQHLKISIQISCFSSPEKERN